jgi:hypothetical protein
VATQILQVLNEAFKFQHAGQSHPTLALQGAAVQQLEDQANTVLARGTTLASQAAQQVGSQ